MKQSRSLLGALLLGACGAPGGSAPLDAEQSAVPVESSTGPVAPSAERIVEPHRMPTGKMPVYGTAMYRPTPDGSTVVSGTLIDDDGWPVKGAHVWTAPGGGMRELQSSDVSLGPVFQTSSTATDSDGRFEIRSPSTENGLLSLLARKDGHSELILSAIDVVRHHELDMGIRVLRHGVPFEVEFVDAEGLPVEGVGLAQVWVEFSMSWYGYAAWHGRSGSDGIVRTRNASGLDAMARDSGWLSAVIPQQLSETLPINDWMDSSEERRRHVLPPRRWIEGRLISATPGRRFAVSTGGEGAFPGGVWSLRHYPNDHPLKRNHNPVTPADGTFRVPTWSGGGHPGSRPQLVLHIERSDGTWQPITHVNIEREAVAETTDHDATFPPIEVRVPQLARIELSTGLYPEIPVGVDIRFGVDMKVAGVTRLPNTGGEFFIALRDIPVGTTQLEVIVSGEGFEDHHVSVAIGKPSPVIDLGRIDVIPKPPINVQFVDSESGEPVEAVIWKLWDSSQHAGLLIHLDGGRSGPDGRTPMHSGTQNAHANITPPLGYQLPDSGWGDIETGPDGIETVVIRLERLDQQTVRVVDVAGRPRPGLIVRNDRGSTPSVTNADGRAVVQGRTDEDGRWHVAVQSAAAAGSYNLLDEWYGGWSFPWDGRPGTLVTIVAPRLAPYRIQARSHGVAVDSLTADDYPFIMDPRWPGSVRIEVAAPGRQVIQFENEATGVSREVRFDHPGPNRTVHIDLSPAVLTGHVVDTDGVPMAGVTVLGRPAEDGDDQPGEADATGSGADVITSEAGWFQLSVTDLGRPMELTFDVPNGVAVTRSEEALGPGEVRDLGQQEVTRPYPDGRRSVLRITLAPDAKESRRVQIWPVDAKFAGDEWTGVRTVHPDKSLLIRGLRGGDYQVDILGLRHVLRTVSVKVIADETVDLVLEND